MEYFFSFIAWSTFSLFIYFDSKRYRKKLEQGDLEALQKIEEPGSWIILTLVIGPFAIPFYLWKTRGPIGLLWSIPVFLGFVVWCGILFALFLLVMFLYAKIAGSQ